MEKERIKLMLRLKKEIDELFEGYNDITEGRNLEPIIISMYSYLEHIYISYCVDDEHREAAAALIEMKKGDYPEPEISDKEREHLVKIFQSVHVGHFSIIQAMQCVEAGANLHDKR